ncbi:MAG: carbohydrate-binding protein, partial [Fibrobacter sp.]|nr:carbohydrate-binding protein [Fibrobacter sp.]
SLRMKADYALEKGAALFITEFGLSMANGNDGIFPDSTKKWLDWADKNGISWANWSLSGQSESSAALTGTASTDGNWTDADISESGKWIKARLLTRPEYDKPIIDTLSIPRIVEAESFVKVSDNGPQAENPGGVSGGGSLGYTKPGCWAEYAISVQEGSTFRAIARVASGDGSNGGTITAKIDEKVVATWNVQNTGGWQSWQLADSSAEFELEPGKYTLHVEWSGEGESLVNLDYIEIISTETSISYRPKLSKKNAGIKISKRNGFVSFNTTKEMKTVSLFTINGRQMFCAPVQSSKMQIPLRNGFYILNIKNHDGKTTTLPISGF